MKRDDSLWKSLLEDIFDDFLEFFVPDAAKIFAFEKGFEFLDKELEQLFPPESDESGTRFVDKLVKVFRSDGTDQWILVHVEVQGYRDNDFAKRMFTYYYRILDRYQKPITAFAIFTDAHKHFHPQRFEQSFLGTSVVYAFNTYKVLVQPETELLESNNPFAMVILSVKAALGMKRKKDEELLLLKIDLAKRLLNKKIPKKKIHSLMSFLKYYVRFENKETHIKFEREIDHFTQTNKTMGLEEFLLDRAEKRGIKKGVQEGIKKGVQEGIKKGVQEGIKKGEERKNTELIQALLKEGSFSAEKIAALMDVSVGLVNKIIQGKR